MTREEQRARKAQQERMRQVERRHKEAARGQMDLPFLILTLLLTVIGLIMLFSASFPRAYYDTGDGTYYFKRQAAFAALGLVAMFIVSKINYQRWRGAGRLLVGLALFLGGAVAALAFAYDMPLVLILVGIVYICETLSDIIQVGYFKLTHGKRIFKMAPLHHHFEMCGWKETKIVAVFSTVSALFCLLAYFAVYQRFSF